MPRPMALAVESDRSTGLRIGIRRQIGLASFLTDLVAMLISYQLALAVAAWFHVGSVSITATVDWGLAVALVLIPISFSTRGLYQLEAWVSRPLHLVTLFSGTLIALMVTALAVFSFKAPLVLESRLLLLSSFAIFFMIAAVTRIGLLDRLYRQDMRRRDGPTVVVGQRLESSPLVERLRELRGYSNIHLIEPLDRRRNGHDAEPQLLQSLEHMELAPRHVFIDGSSIGHKATLDIIGTLQGRGAEIYITGRLVSRLDFSRIMFRLFELPVIRVRRHDVTDPDDALLARADHITKRAFDVAAASLALLALMPLLAMIALLIKRDSPGPVLFRQQRVGRRGVPFEVVKFRTMKTDNDPSVHREYTCRLIENGDAACHNDNGEKVYKLLDDDRVTGIGRSLRKWSLDELPQLWNVVRGDMSLVGPRPALDYEVAAYKPWHLSRLNALPGISGLWQVAGRSRVTFDEMVFQDVIYTHNQSLLTDLTICIRTIPAVLVGRGAA